MSQKIPNGFFHFPSLKYLTGDKKEDDIAIKCYERRRTIDKSPTVTEKQWKDVKNRNFISTPFELENFFNITENSSLTGEKVLNNFLISFCLQELQAYINHKSVFLAKCIVLVNEIKPPHNMLQETFARRFFFFSLALVYIFWLYKQLAGRFFAFLLPLCLLLPLPCSIVCAREKIVLIRW